MSKKFKLTELIGLIVEIISSFLFHYIYEWIGTLSFLFAVNESVWEHIKIVFMPYLIYTIIELFVLKPKDIWNFLAIKSLALIAIPISLIVMFYTYSGIIGDNVLVIDILIGIITAIIAFAISYKLLASKYELKCKNTLIVLASLVILMFVVFTYYPPNINLFSY